jgi:hypothetical protein
MKEPSQPRKNTNAPEKCTKIIHLPGKCVNKNFFLSTLDISYGIFTRVTFGAKEIGITKHDRSGCEGRTPTSEN